MLLPACSGRPMAGQHAQRLAQLAHPEAGQVRALVQGHAAAGEDEQRHRLLVGDVGERLVDGVAVAVADQGDQLILAHGLQDLVHLLAHQQAIVVGDGLEAQQMRQGLSNS